MIEPGSVVGKRGLAGWRGEVVSATDHTANIYWVGNKYPELCKLDVLEPVEKPYKWDEFSPTRRVEKETDRLKAQRRKMKR